MRAPLLGLAKSIYYCIINEYMKLNHSNISPLASCSISCFHRLRQPSSTATSVSVTWRGAGVHRTSDKGHGEGVGECASVTIPMVLMGVGEPDRGVFISTSTSESSSSLDGGVLWTNDRALSRTSWIGQRLEPWPYLRYLKYDKEVTRKENFVPWDESLFLTKPTPCCNDKF